MAPWQTDRNLEPARVKVNASRVEPCSGEAGAKCTTCLGAIAVFALIVVTACGGGGSSSGDNPTYGGTLSVDDDRGDHQHTFFVPASTVTAPPSTGFVGNTSNNFPPNQLGAVHNHSIFLTQGDLSDLEAGVPVTGVSQSFFFHSHSFVFGSSGGDGGSSGGDDPPVSGCTDPNASNFDPAAVVDDGSCIPPLPLTGELVFHCEFRAVDGQECGPCEFTEPPLKDLFVRNGASGIGTFDVGTYSLDWDQSCPFGIAPFTGASVEVCEDEVTICGSSGFECVCPSDPSLPGQLLFECRSGSSCGPCEIKEPFELRRITIPSGGEELITLPVGPFSLNWDQSCGFFKSASVEICEDEVTICGSGGGPCDCNSLTLHGKVDIP